MFFKKVLWYFQIFAAKRGDPNKFQSFWEMDEEDVDEESMEEIQSKTIGDMIIMLPEKFRGSI